MTDDTDPPKLTPLQQQLVDILAEARYAGLTQREVADVLCRTSQQVSTIVTALKTKGLICWERETGGDSRVWVRLWLVRYQRRVPAPVLGTTTAAHRVGTLDDPFGVRKAPRMVDPAQCRPWAVAVSRSAAC